MPTLSQLKQAVSIAEQIEKLQATLASLVGGSAPVASAPKAASSPVAKAGKRTMSPEARARIAAAQRARWAKSKGHNQSSRRQTHEEEGRTQSRRPREDCGGIKGKVGQEEGWQEVALAAPAD
jgi:hypothetical protein